MMTFIMYMMRLFSPLTWQMTLDITHPLFGEMFRIDNELLVPDWTESLVMGQVSDRGIWITIDRIVHKRRTDSVAEFAFGTSLLTDPQTQSFADSSKKSPRLFQDSSKRITKSKSKGKPTLRLRTLKNSSQTR